MQQNKIYIISNTLNQMSSATKLQQHLSYIDTGLFVCLKTIRRALEVLQFDWVITGELAVDMYAYMAGLAPIISRNLMAQLYINRSVKSSLEEEVAGLINYLEQVGFSVMNELSTDSIILVHNNSSTRYQFIMATDQSIFDDNQRVWIRNKNNKLLYPLLDPIRLERQLLRSISYVYVDKKDETDALSLAEYHLVDKIQKGIEFTLSLFADVKDKVLIAKPMLMPSERQAGLRIYEWAKFVLSESLLTTEAETTEIMPNRFTKDIIVTKPKRMKIHREIKKQNNQDMTLSFIKNIPETIELPASKLKQLEQIKNKAQKL